MKNDQAADRQDSSHRTSTSVEMSSARAMRAAIGADGVRSPETQRETDDSLTPSWRANAHRERPSSESRAASNSPAERPLPMQDSIADWQVLASRKTQNVLARPLTDWQDPEMTDGTPSGFGARLKLAMQQRKWNQTKLASASGLSAPAVSRHLKSKDPPTVDTVEKYRIALGVSAEWLAHGRGSTVGGESMLEERARVGLEALRHVLDDFEWPDIDITIVDAAIAQAEREAEGPGSGRPTSAWRLRLRQIVREIEAPTRSAITPRKTVG